MSESQFKTTVNLLYTGRSRGATLFRYALIGFDVFTIVFIVATAPRTPSAAVLVADIVIGTAILADFMARLWIASSKIGMLKQVHTIADILVILSLVLAPFLAPNLAFLRVLRMLRLLHSYQVLRDLRRETPLFQRHEEVIVSSVNLMVFIFATTAIVFVLQFGENPRITNYLDALYFTVSTLTTTGFGDVTLTGDIGRLLSVFVMIVGVALFLRLAQSIFRPQKINHPCPNCGLSRHEPDAVHCKHCGKILKIATEGAD